MHIAACLCIILQPVSILDIKGTVSRDFFFRFFSFTFPQAPENNIRVISNFVKNSRRYLQVKIYHRCQLHRWQVCPRYQRHWQQFLPPKQLVLLIQPDIVTIICHQCQQHRRQICHRWQIMVTISGCRHLTLNLKAKIYIYVNSNTQRCPNKITKIFLIEDFSICHLKSYGTVPLTVKRKVTMFFAIGFFMKDCETRRPRMTRLVSRLLIISQDQALD